MQGVQLPHPHTSLFLHTGYVGRECEVVPWTPEVVQGKRKAIVGTRSPEDQLLQWLQSPSQTSHLEGRTELQSHSLRTHDPPNNMENHWL